MNDAGAERRVLERTRGRFPAVVRATDLADRDIVISDVSEGGLFAALQLSTEEARSPVGQVVGLEGSVEVHCTLRDGRPVSVRCRAVRVSTGGLGLCFTQPEPQFVRALLAEFSAPTTAVTVVAQGDRNTIVNALKNVVLDWMSTRFSAFAKQAESRLVARASQSHSNAEQTPFFDAIAELKRCRVEVEGDLTEALQTRLFNLGENFDSETAKAVELASGQLSLVDKDEFERFLSVADMTTKAENRNDQHLYMLCRRLSSVAGVPIDNTNNPIGPASLVGPFHEAMRNAPMTPEALAIVYRAFDDLVMGSAEELYSSANEALEAACVEPILEPTTAYPETIRHGVSKKRDKKTSAGKPNPPGAPDEEAAFSDSDMLEMPQELAPAQEPAALENHGAAPGDGSPFGSAPFEGSPSGDHRAPADYATANSGNNDVWGRLNHSEESVWTPAPAHAPQSDLTSLEEGLDVPGAEQLQAGGLASAGTGGPAGSVVQQAGLPGVSTGQVSNTLGIPIGAPAGPSPFIAGGGSLSVPTQFQIPQSANTAFGTAHSMLGLSRSFAGGEALLGRPPGSSASAPDTSIFSNTVPFADREDAAPIEIEQLVGILNQLQGALTSQGERGSFRGKLREALSSDDEGPKSLAGEMGDAVELVMGLFEAFREDPEVGIDLETRLDMLEPATHKIALLDPSFFELPDHPARQLLNQLARLVPELGDGESPTEEFWGGIDALLAPLLRNFERDVSLYLEVLRELDGLVASQFETYRTNTDAVVAACDAQQAFVRARGGLSNSTPGETGARGVSKEWAIWLNRTARLEVGERLELCESGNEQKRVTLAWVGDGHSSFVFVDQFGEKTLTLSRQELAMHLRRGSASILHAADLPLVDRALDRVLRDLHGLLERRATRDLRTGLLNRKALMTRLRDALEQPTSNGDGVAVLGFQVTDYVGVLEEHGQDAADILLRRVARGVGDLLGPDPMMACIDESTLIACICDTTLQIAADRADEVCKSISELSITWGDEPPCSPVLRASVVVAPPGESPITVLQTIEEKVRKTHATGLVASDLLPAAKSEAGELDFAELIQKMLSSERLQLRCHRIAPLSAGRRDRSYFEILLGLRDAQGELVPPADLVRAALATGLMQAVDRWVIRNTLRWMAENRRWLRKVSGFAINLSSQSLSDPELVEYVLDQLSTTGVPPGKIIFEVTETVAVDNSSHAQNFLRTLSEVGARFALDDFGSGQLSYGFLKKLPVEYVKIDGMFVRDIERDEADLAFVQAVNKVAHFMGKKTVAEFVQSASSVAQLRQIGVDLGQGFFIDEPRYLEDVTEEMLASAPAVLDALDTFPEDCPEHASVSVEETLRL